MWTSLTHDLRQGPSFLRPDHISETGMALQATPPPMDVSTTLEDVPWIRRDAPLQEFNRLTVIANERAHERLDT